MKSLNKSFNGIDELQACLDIQGPEDSPSLLIQIFSGWPDKKSIESMMDIIVKRYPLACIIGTTTDGEITNGSVSTQKVSISFTKFEKTSLSLCCLQKDERSSFELGNVIAPELIGDKTKAVILFAAGLELDGEAILEGVRQYNNEVTIAGGMSGDNSLFRTPFVFSKKGVLTDSVIGVSLNSSDLIVQTGYSFDWELIGKEMRITQSEGNRIYTIDDLSVVEVYEKYLGWETADALPASGSEFPLVLIRNGVSVARAGMVKHDDGSLTVAGSVETGDIVKFAFGSPEMIINPSSGLKDRLMQTPAEVIFIYSCMGRRRFMPDIIEKELKPIEDVAPTCGFFTYGEFYHHDIRNELLNQTMTILVLSENKEIEHKKNIAPEANAPTERNYTNTVRALSHFVNSTLSEMEKLNVSLKEEAAKRYEQEKLLMQQSRYAAMGEMISAIAHQWRQPINALNLVIANMKDAYAFGKLDAEYLEKSVAKSNRLIQKMSTTIDDFRDFFRPHKNSVEFDVKDVIEDSISLLEGVFHDSEISIETSFTSEIKVNGYPNEFSQAILNILNNAKDALIEKGDPCKKIFIKLHENTTCIYVVIEDTGGGIPKAIIDKIFDPYFTTKKSTEGTGIGLYMTHSIIVDHMQGNIQVENGDMGAKVTVILPRMKSDQKGSCV